MREINYEERSHLLDLVRDDLSPKQVDVLESWVELGGIVKVAKKLGVTHQYVSREVKVAKKLGAARGYAPEYGYDKPVPDPMIAKGVSVYYPATEESPAKWVKGVLDRSQLQEILRQCADEFYAGLPKIEPRTYTEKHYNKDIVPWFQIGDAHLGMLAHSSEVGHNFDLKIAVRDLMAAFSILFDESPACERCVINDLGDFTHYENYKKVTENAGHQLDGDGRFHKMIKYYVPLMRFIIEKALEKYKYVDVIVNQGNHSRTNDIWMAQLLSNVYENEPRISVVDNSSVFITYKMGNTFVMVHHGDKSKVKSLPAVMATDYPEAWGSCKFRYIDTGHVHHGFTSKEHPGVTVESWNNLATTDKYAFEGGWRSRQSITRVDRSRTYGNVGRRTVPLEEIRDIIKSSMKKAKKLSKDVNTKMTLDHKVYSV